MVSGSEIELELELEDPEDEASLFARAQKKLGARKGEVLGVRVLKRSVDARRGKIRIHILLDISGEPSPELGLPHPKETRGPKRVVIVGDGPAGLFCAYQLARAGIPSVVLERGKPVQPRRRDLKLLNARGGVNPDSNYCFGEGGAGTYSDGKLYTRSHKRGDIRDVLEVFALHGAPPSILTENRPHIGSNLLPQVISAMRARLEDVGVEFRFGTRLTRIVTTGVGAEKRVKLLECVNTETGETSEVLADWLVLATGHSARDVYHMAEDAGLRLEAKSFALGVRIEHPQELINEIQYGKFAGHPKLGAAAYRVAEEVEGRGVFSFCMCPGGWVVPAHTDAEHLVVNGMSLSKRDSAFANSGLVVSVDVADLGEVSKNVWAGVELQARAETKAMVLGGGGNKAPATRVTDFLAGRPSSTVPETSYLPGLVPTDVREALAATGLDLAGRMRRALLAFGKSLRGYVTNEAVLIGVESRTSSPLRIPRDSASLEAIGVRQVYPTGEGAGYAGGIVSAAVDGLRVGAVIAAQVGSSSSSA
jgi:uncharacterized protein